MIAVGYLYVRALAFNDEREDGMRGGAGERAWGVAGWVYLVALVLFAVLPMLWMLLTSIKSQFVALQYPPVWIPTTVTFEQYTRLLSPTGDVGSQFLRYMWNSILVSGATTVIGVAIAVPAAYAFSRFRFPG